jgi:hypothetical protein
MVPLFCFLLTTTKTFSQIRVNANGEIKIGNEWPNNNYSHEVTIEAFGLNMTSFRPGAKFSFGDYGGASNGSANVFMGEYGTYDSDALQLHGKQGIYFTTRYQAKNWYVIIHIG